MIHWEQSGHPAARRPLLSVAWVVDHDTGKTRPTPYALSHDGRDLGKGLTGFLGQTTKLVELPDGRVLAAYRRNDEPGLWATIARIDGDRWVNEETGRSGRASVRHGRPETRARSWRSSSSASRRWSSGPTAT